MYNVEFRASITIRFFAGWIINHGLALLLSEWASIREMGLAPGWLAQNRVAFSADDDRLRVAEHRDDLKIWTRGSEIYEKSKQVV